MTSSEHKLSGFFKSTIRTLVPRELRNWLRSPSKSAAWISDAVGFQLGKRQVLWLSAQHDLVCHPRAYKVFRRDQEQDPDQRSEFQGFLSRCSDTMLLFDIGAHFGIFSLAAARFGGTAIAVDPSPIAIRMIHILAKLNGCEDRIRLVEAAVGDTAKAMEILSAGVFSDGYYKVIEPLTRKDSQQVQSTTVDQITEQFGVPTHVKIDVEGHEAAVLRGAQLTLSQHAPEVFLELHTQMVASEGREPRQALDELESLGYAFYLPSGDVADRSTILRKPIARVVASRSTRGR